MASETRREEIREIQKDYKWLYALILGAILLGIGVWIGVSLIADKDGYGMNLFTELLGIGGTVFIIDQLRAYRDKESLKRRLVREAGSRSNDLAISAVEWISDENWLIGEKGLLKGVRLAEADLRNADLRSANMQEADLWKTNLQSADLLSTKLQGAFLVKAELQNAKLLGAKLQDANLRAANLQGADLTYADLRGADLTDANLQNAKLRHANLEGISLHFVNLQEADLGRVDLKSADLFGVNLQDANLDRAIFEKANLQNVNLEKANLSGAYMKGATISFLEGPVVLHRDRPGEPGRIRPLTPTLLRGATLPDGEPFLGDSSSHDELERFTNPEHPDFHKTIEKIEEIHRNWDMIE